MIVTKIDIINEILIASFAVPEENITVTTYTIRNNITGKLISNAIVFALLLLIDSWIHIFYNLLD
jgi:hypothetical protein